MFIKKVNKTMLSSIWNNKLKGLWSAIHIGARIAFEKLRNKISTFRFTNNIKRSGNNCYIMKGLVYRYPSLISVGSNVIIGKNTSITTEYVDPSAEIIIYDNVSIGDNCEIDYTGGICIKEQSHISHNVRIITHDHGYDYLSIPVGKSLTIGTNVFVGVNTMILQNCNYIGNNAVIGVGSVVTKDVPDNAIVAGNPARIIKYRTDKNEDSVI